MCLPYGAAVSGLELWIYLNTVEHLAHPAMQSVIADKVDIGKALCFQLRQPQTLISPALCDRGRVLDFLCVD